MQYEGLLNKLNINYKKLVEGFANVFEVNPNWHEADFPLFVVEASNSVGILIYDEVKDAVVIVKQKRAAMISEKDKDGSIEESIAGRFDSDIKHAVELAIAETEEETGIKITEKDVIILNNGNSLALSPGVLTEKMYLVAAIISEEHYNNEQDKYGNQHEGEHIERKSIPLEDIRNGSYEFEDMKLFAMCQWLIGHLILN